MRISQHDLEVTVNRLNETADQPLEPWNRESGPKANLGNYHLDGAYGGWQLQQIVSAGGGCKVISEGGYVPKRELFHQIHAFIKGLETGRMRVLMGG